MAGSDGNGYLTGVATRDHEVGHLLGMDERYNGATKRPHTGFEDDVMSNNDPVAYFINPMNPIHLVDLLDYALQYGVVNGTIVVGNTGGGSGKTYTTKFEIDDTNSGKTEESTESVENKKSRVVNKTKK